jgi:hypothetical protein
MDKKVHICIFLVCFAAFLADAYAIPGRVIYTPPRSGGIFYSNGSQYVPQTKGLTQTQSKPKSSLSVGEWLALMPDEVAQDMLNMRAKKPGQSLCSQDGYSICKADYLTYFALKKTFNDQTVYDTHKPLEYQNFASNMICFADTSIGQTRSQFQLDTSVWWTNDRGPNITVRMHPRTAYNFSIYHQDNRFCFDFQTNETVDCGSALCYSDIWNTSIQCGDVACRGSGNKTVACE